jgi:hypothetical protein
LLAGITCTGFAGCAGVSFAVDDWALVVEMSAMIALV